MKINFNKFINQKIFVIFSDPWELGTECGLEHSAKIIAFSEKKELLILKLDNIIIYKDKKYQYIMASVRHKGDSIYNLFRDNCVSFGFASVDEVQVFSDNPFKEIHAKYFFALGTLKLVF